MAQMTFEALVDWLIAEANIGNYHDFEKLNVPETGQPTAFEFFTILHASLNELHDYGVKVEINENEWTMISAFGLVYIQSIDYDIEESFFTKSEAIEFIYAKEEQAKEESDNFKDTFNDLKRWSDDGC